MDEKTGRSGFLRRLVMLAAAAAGVMTVLRKKREAELDEALWEEPRAL